MTNASRWFTTWRSLAAAMLVGLAVATAAIPAAAQTSLAELLRKSPPLANATEAIQTVEFEGIIPLGDVRIELTWSRADGYFIALIDPKSGVPIVVATDDRMMQFVAADGAIELTPDFRAGLTLKSTSDKFSFGLTKTKGPRSMIDIDPASFLAEVKEAGEWEQRTGGVLRLTALSPSGKSRMFVDFDPAQAYPLRRFEMQSVDDKKTMLLIDDLRVNQPLRRKLKPAPNDAEFPPGIVIARTSGPATETMTAEFALMMKIAMRVGTSAAIDDPTLRTGFEKLEKIDWEAAKANRAKFGPGLIKLFAREAP